MEAVVALRRVRRLLMFGGLAIVAFSWVILIWLAAGVLWSVAGWAALLAYPVAGIGYLAAFAIIGSPGIRYRWFWAAVVYGCSFSVMAASFAVLIATLDAKPGAAPDRGMKRDA